MSKATNRFIVGSSLGDPYSTSTYSGVPVRLFQELENRSMLVGRVNSFIVKPVDIFSSIVDWRRSLKNLSPRKDSLWRYRPVGMNSLTHRLAKYLRKYPHYESVFQIGVGALPPSDKKLYAHVEISVSAAMDSPIFGPAYGFSGHSKRHKFEAIEGELRFLQRCTKIWTNTEWTAQTLYETGIDPSKVVIYPPGVGVDDPGLVNRKWDELNILFVGKDWERKGGPLLLSAFEEIKKYNNNAKLTIVGCTPPIMDADGIEIVGYIDTSTKSGKDILTACYRKATVFCMPSHWESTGIVYMEAGLWGLPCILLSGQGRDKIFPAESGFSLLEPDVDQLAHTIIELHRKPDIAQAMGDAARKHILENYMWSNVVDYLEENMLESDSGK